MSSVARPNRRLDPDPPVRKRHEICVCTMLRNQAQFLREWVVYHARIGIQRWFIYDNNSDDDISSLIESLNDENFNITRHLWPWIKTQEAGFSHCALRARDSCEWVGFIDVDEFLHFPSGSSLHDVIGNLTGNVAELRVSCHSFGPSGLKRVPAKGVTQGYTCRMAAPERHKSIVRPEALNSTLINSVHHFHLASGFEFVNMKRHVLVINHYKYPVWEVFKEKFYRRVATYVADWQEDENVGSKDRTPGLGTRPVEPPDWPTRFCEIVDDYSYRHEGSKKMKRPTGCGLEQGTFGPQLVSSWPTPSLKSINGDWRVAIVQETVLFPDQALIFLKYPRATPLFSKDDIECVYFSPNSSQPHLNLQPDSIDGDDLDLQIVRCPLQPHGIIASVDIKSNGHLLPLGPTYHWDLLAYDALIDNDNTTIVFVKGLNLRPERVMDPSRFKCVYGRDFNRSKLLVLAESWFIYDNNNDDDISSLIELLDEENFNIIRHVWPWIKSQEARFAHCALRTRNSCEWVGFIDVDEFLHFPSGLSLHDVIGNSTRNVAELRVKCHSFGPSGLKRVPAEGVTQGYTCRLAAAERHKSIVRPDALNSTLINSVHHFHLTSGFEVVNVKRNVLVINHYKYQVWELFKEKFIGWWLLMWRIG
ncbi:hypothetical protein RHSIM_Rhsim10G0011800 [Rhododendron simsii]|uniref:Glycosyltransferase family 92 protein n=1 Tax=Rhododendron simsii TaxID=118357 RepID=A0A834LEI7_RHOSS|nr:hypothetical protein RHSIM_Rhsim10G0011800 [Rhododendron simsii]